MPIAQIVAVVTFVAVAGRRSEVVEIAGSPERVVFVVAGSGLRAILVTTPGWFVAILKLCRRSVLICVIARREHRPRDAVQEGGRRFSRG